MLEFPAIIKAKNHKKQALNSTINVSAMIISGAVLGAILSTIHPSLSLVGLGIGSYLGTLVSKKVTASHSYH